MVLAAAGNVDHDELVSAAKSAFSSLPADSTSAAELVAAEPSHFTGSAVAVRDPDSPATTLTIAFQGSDWLSPDSVTLQVCDTWPRVGPCVSCHSSACKCGLSSKYSGLCESEGMKVA